MRYTRMLLTVSLILLLTACSTQIGYRFADTLVEWELDEFVELTSDEAQQVDQAITELHYWHATQELPFYAEQLENLRDKIAEQTLTENDIADAYDTAFTAWQRMLTAIEPHALTLLPALSDAQVQQIEKELAKRLAEERDELAEFTTAEARQKNLRKRSRERARSWLQRPTPLQERLLNDWSEQRQPTRELWLAYTEAWQASFIEVLRNRHNENEFPVQLKQLMFHSDALYSATLAERIAHNREHTMTLFYKLYQSLTPKQRQRIVNKLDDYITDFNELAVLFAERGPE